MLGGDNRTVLGFDPQRESALTVNPAGKLLARRRDGSIDGGTAALDHLLGHPLTPPVLLSQANRRGHRLPLPARIVGIDGYEHSCKPARLLGIHEYPCAGPHEIGRSF